MVIDMRISSPRLSSNLFLFVFFCYFECLFKFLFCFFFLVGILFCHCFLFQYGQMRYYASCARACQHMIIHLFWFGLYYFRSYIWFAAFFSRSLLSFVFRCHRYFHLLFSRFILIIAWSASNAFSFTIDWSSCHLSTCHLHLFPF